MVKYVFLLTAAAISFSQNVFADGGTPAEPSGDGDCVTVYTGNNYSGTATELCHNGSTTKSFTSSSGGFSNNSTSSIKVGDSAAVLACTNSSVSGDCQTYYKDTKFVGDDLDNRFSYFKVINFQYDDFIMVIQSDPQYPWTSWACRDGLINCNSDAEKEAYADNLNQAQVDMANKVLSDKGYDRVGGLIINGDLTSYGHDHQLVAFREFYEDGTNLNLYAGLGNHDYENNVNKCTPSNSCATRMYEYFVNHVENVLVADNFDYNESSAYYDFPSYHKDRTGSLSYSFDIGPIHFVQLNNHPTYTTSWEYWNFWDALNDKFFVEDPALAWLEADLKAASEAGQHIFLNYHDPDGWGDGKADGSTDSYFEYLLGKYKVTAIFAGHKHDELGEFMDYDNVHSGTVDVPVILSGGVEAKSALMVRFNDKKDQVVVKTIDTTGGSYQVLDQETYTMY